MAKEQKRSENEIMADLLEVLETLEGPENIAGDGEYPASKVKATYRKLHARRDKCYKELGREPTDDEVFAWGEKRQQRQEQEKND